MEKTIAAEAANRRTQSAKSDCHFLHRHIPCPALEQLYQLKVIAKTAKNINLDDEIGPSQEERAAVGFSVDSEVVLLNVVA